MKLTGIRRVYDQEGPFATVYLESRAPAEDAQTQMRLRWNGLRERLEENGAEAAALDAIDAELQSGTSREEQADGRVLVANSSGVVLDAPWDAALGAGDDAHWGVLPELGAYARERARAVRELVVVPDQQGAHLRQEVVAQQHQPRDLATEDVSGGGTDKVHKPRGGALSHNQIQRRKDEVVKRNAKDVVSRIGTVAANFEPRVVVLAGEVQARTEVRDLLPPDLAPIAVEAERGGLDQHGSDDQLAEQLLEIAGRESERGQQDAAERLEAGIPHGNAVHGDAPVAKAAEMGAVDTLLFEDGAAASREAFLLKTCAETDSEFALLPEGTGTADGVAALLRFPIGS